MLPGNLEPGTPWPSLAKVRDRAHQALWRKGCSGFLQQTFRATGSQFQQYGRNYNHPRTRVGTSPAITPHVVGSRASRAVAVIRARAVLIKVMNLGLPPKTSKRRWVGFIGDESVFRASAQIAKRNDHRAWRMPPEKFVRIGNSIAFFFRGAGDFQPRQAGSMARFCAAADFGTGFV